MSSIITDIRKEYGLTQIDLSELLHIPKRTIENWDSGSRKPSTWISKLIIETLGKYPMNKSGLISKYTGIYELDEIREKVQTIAQDYNISKVVVFGSYANGKAKKYSDIDLYIEGELKPFDFFGLLEELHNKLFKDIDLVHKLNTKTGAKIFDVIEATGVTIYER